LQRCYRRSRTAPPRSSRRAADEQAANRGRRTAWFRWSLAARLPLVVACRRAAALLSTNVNDVYASRRVHNDEAFVRNGPGGAFASPLQCVAAAGSPPRSAVVRYSLFFLLFLLLLLLLLFRPPPPPPYRPTNLLTVVTATLRCFAMAVL